MFTISKNNEDRVVGVKKKMYTLVKRRQRDWKLKCGFVRSEDWMHFEWWINLNVSASNSYSFNYIMSMLSSWKTSMIQIEFWNLSFERLNCINILALHNELDLFLFIFSLGHLHLFTMSAARFSFNLMLVHHVYNKLTWIKVAIWKTKLQLKNKDSFYSSLNLKPLLTTHVESKGLKHFLPS
jgi:hypothetical protein